MKIGTCAYCGEKGCLLEQGICMDCFEKRDTSSYDEYEFAEEYVYLDVVGL